MNTVKFYETGNNKSCIKSDDCYEDADMITVPLIGDTIVFRDRTSGVVNRRSYNTANYTWYIIIRSMVRTHQGPLKNINYGYCNN